MSFLYRAAGMRLHSVGTSGAAIQMAALEDRRPAALGRLSLYAKLLVNEMIALGHVP